MKTFRLSDVNTRMKILGGFTILILVALVITIISWSSFYQSNKNGNGLLELRNVQNKFILTRYNALSFRHTQSEKYMNIANQMMDTCIMMAINLRDGNLKGVSIKMDRYVILLQAYKAQLAGTFRNLKKKNELFNQMVSILDKMKTELDNGRVARQSELMYNYMNMRSGGFEYSINHAEPIAQLVESSSAKSMELSEKQHLNGFSDFSNQYENTFANYKKTIATIDSAYVQSSALGQEITAMSNEVIAEVAVYLQSHMKSSVIRMAILIILLIIFGIADGLFISGYYVRKLGKGVKIATAFSEGNFNVSITKEELEAGDEMGDLSRALQMMGEKLKDITKTVQEQAMDIALAGQRISSTSELLSSGANQQATSVEEISSSMEEMVSNTDQNTNNALETEKISNQSTTLIKEVTEAAEKSLDSVRTITERISIINDIAFQTNLLALNAAVEAARAGENGKGFAVVASEVRKLAENSKKAADEVIIMARDSKQLTEKSVDLMKRIKPEIEKTTSLIHEIAAASQEQLTGADQINNAIQQLNELTQGTASAAEDLAAGAEQLNAQSENLIETMSFFKFSNGEQKQEVKPVSTIKFKISNTPKVTEMIS